MSVRIPLPLDSRGRWTPKPATPRRHRCRLRLREAGAAARCLAVRVTAPRWRAAVDRERHRAELLIGRWVPRRRSRTHARGSARLLSIRRLRWLSGAGRLVTESVAKRADQLPLPSPLPIPRSHQIGCQPINAGQSLRRPAMVSRIFGALLWNITLPNVIMPPLSKLARSAGPFWPTGQVLCASSSPRPSSRIPIAVSERFCGTAGCAKLMRASCGTSDALAWRRAECGATS